MTLAIAGCCGIASASEDGVGTYRPGFMDLMSGVLPPPGTTAVKSYFLTLNANTDMGTGPISVRANTVSFTEDILLMHVTNLKLLDGNYAFGGVMQNHLIEQSLGIGPRGFSVPRKTETFGGLGDTILLPAMFNWNLRNFHFLSLMAVYVPTGFYNSKRIVNTGLNRWALEPDFGVTWLDPDTGHEASLFTGYTINSRNGATDYRSGDEFHADFAVAQHLPHAITTGVSGYAVQQTTPDTGSGAIFGGFRGRVLGLGPIVDKIFMFGEYPVDFTVKYDFEFAAQHRATGNECWVTAALPL